jgi:hypothetical protein
MNGAQGSSGRQGGFMKVAGRWADAVIVVFTALRTGCVAPVDLEETPQTFVGTAEMRVDGTIILQLGSTSFNGAANKRRFEYPPDAPGL